MQEEIAGVSPTKTSNSSSEETNVAANGDSEKSYTVPKLTIVDGNSAIERVARLSISELPSEAIEESSDIKSLRRKLPVGKRRRSSAYAVNGSQECLKPIMVKGLESITETLGAAKVVKKRRAKEMKTPLNVEIEYTKSPTIRAMSDLVRYLHNASNEYYWWKNISGRHNLSKNIVIFVPGLQPEDFGLEKEQRFLDNFNELQEKGLVGLDLQPDKKIIFPMQSPGSKTAIYSAYNSFVNVPLSKKQKKDLVDKLSRTKITINELIADIDQLVGRDYPIHEETPNMTALFSEKLKIKNQEDSLKNRWVDTKPFEHDGSHIYGLDCEMCQTERGLVVARVSLVDFQMNVIYDELVIPEAPITDYLTKYSGITKEKLDTATKNIEEVQNDLANIISTDDVLIGHSLSNDLHVLRMRHPKIVDTAIIYDHHGGPPFKPSLKYLASEYLHKTIQEEIGDEGHDSIEDAKTCIELTKLKIMNGPAYGSFLKNESLFKVLSDKGVKSLILNNTVPKSELQNSEFIGTKFCDSDQAVFEGITEHLNEYDLFVGRLRELEFARGYATPKNPISLSATDVLQKLSGHIQKLYETVPEGTIISILSGSGDTKSWMALMNQINTCNPKEARSDLKKELSEEIRKAVEIARDAIIEILIKE
ncbi:RNA exonuclease 1 [Nakaseomyces bracarensis]|uniref:RNA exonuclease 1 n=1 Tax=Nakaseomyces bracarensis TaxID=273131 RepID=A0ABR4NWW2_9SACH